MEDIMDDQKNGSLGETIRTIAVAVLIAVVFRSFAFQPFNIPSESMVPTLLVGDYLFVSKYAYGYSRHSLPFSPPVMHGRIFEKPVERGDVAVFKLPRDGRTDYIKRIIGLPGDTIAVKGEQLFIDGKPVPQALVGPYRGTDKVSIQMQENPMMSPVTLHEEDLDGARHQILQFGYIEQYNCIGSGGVMLPGGGCQWTVPQGHYFAMGDNRDDSEDSRFWGFVPEGNLAGKAFFIWFSLADWHRIGTVLR